MIQAADVGLPDSIDLYSSDIQESKHVDVEETQERENVESCCPMREKNHRNGRDCQN
jgi:hypothetical protein